MSENLPKVAQILFYFLVIEFILAVVRIDGKSLMPKSLAMPVFLCTLVLFIGTGVVYLLKVRKSND
jgi:hypothetical protein